MMIASVLYDGTWKGLLSSIFVVFERKLEAVTISRIDRYQPAVFGEEIKVATDEQKAKRVLTGLRTKTTSKALNDIFSCFLSELEGVENTILSFVRLIFSEQEGIEFAFGHPSVLQVAQIGKMVHREKHRMEAFIRFRLTQDNIYYAAIEPDFNVIPLIAKHFKNRYADQKWVIYDLKRKYGIYYDLETVEEILFEFSREAKASDISGFVSEDEVKYETLWQDYFKHVNIGERKNMKLHLRHVPKRYWKYLPEKV